MSAVTRPVIAVFGSSQSQPGQPEYADGVLCGRLLAEAGLAVATGGYGGLMEAVCRGAAEAGGETIGVTAPTVFPGRPGANRWVQHEMPAPDLVRRIAMLTEVAGGYIALPGSIGTLAELVVVWNLAFVAPMANERFGPVATVGEVWSELVPLLNSKLDSDRSSIACFASVEEAVRHVAAAIG